jgi:hypothetical protein
MVPHEIGCTLENTTDWAKMLAHHAEKRIFPIFFPANPGFGQPPVLQIDFHTRIKKHRFSCRIFNKCLTAI